MLLSDGADSHSTLADELALSVPATAAPTSKRRRPKDRLDPDDSVISNRASHASLEHPDKITDVAYKTAYDSFAGASPI